jgi:hypothetical protein
VGFDVLPVWTLFVISSSQPGGQPANLQGIWNESTNQHGTANTPSISSEMNYWPAENAICLTARTAYPNGEELSKQAGNSARHVRLRWLGGASQYRHLAYQWCCRRGFLGHVAMGSACFLNIYGKNICIMAI